jgi:hypothetical protein
MGRRRIPIVQRLGPRERRRRAEREAAKRPHVFRRAPELGPHVCAECPLGEYHAVHDVSPPPDMRERYEVER